jgi:hypothetical protein
VAATLTDAAERAMELLLGTHALHAPPSPPPPHVDRFAALGRARITGGPASAALPPAAALKEPVAKKAAAQKPAAAAQQLRRRTVAGGEGGGGAPVGRAAAAAGGGSGGGGGGGVAAAATAGGAAAAGGGAAAAGGGEVAAAAGAAHIVERVCGKHAVRDYLSRAGWDLQRKKKHYVLRRRLPSGRTQTTTLSATPSDVRTDRNVVAGLRRADRDAGMAAHG